MGRLTFDHGGAQLLHLVDRRENRGGDVRREVGGEILHRHADAHARQRPRAIAGQLPRVVLLRPVDAGGVARVEAAHDVHHQREVPGAAGERPALVERGGERDHAKARHRAIGRPEPAGAGKGRRLADRAARVRARRGRNQPGRDRRGGAPRASARHAGPVPGIFHRAEEAVLVRRAHRELVHVGLAGDHRARPVELLDHVRVIGRDEVAEDLRPAGGAPALRAEEVLVRHRDAGERPSLAPCDHCICNTRLGEALLVIDRDEGIEPAVEAVDARERRPRQLFARELPRAQGLGKLFQGEIVHGGQGAPRGAMAPAKARMAYSRTLGTR